MEEMKVAKKDALMAESKVVLMGEMKVEMKVV